MRKLRDAAVLFGAAGLFWYGAWCFCHYVLHFDVVQSWLGVLVLLIVIVWYVWNDKKEADDLPYVIVEKLVPPIEQGLDMEDKR